MNIKIFRKPQILSTLVQGKDRELGSGIEFNYLHLPIQTSGYMGEFASQHHRYVSGFGFGRAFAMESGSGRTGLLGGLAM